MNRHTVVGFRHWQAGRTPFLPEAAAAASSASLAVSGRSTVSVRCSVNLKTCRAKDGSFRQLLCSRFV